MYFFYLINCIIKILNVVLVGRDWPHTWHRNGHQVKEKMKM